MVLATVQKYRQLETNKLHDAAVLLNIGDMIDLAIGTPEVGVVDFNMLQTVLHCLAQQLRVLGKNVEVRGSLASLPIVRDNVQTISIQEYAVDTDNQQPDVHKPVPATTPPAEDTILVVERVKKSEATGQHTSAAKTGEFGSQHASGGSSAGPRRSVPGATHGSAGTQGSHDVTEKISLVTVSKFNVLENTVEDLKNRVYGSMPKNEDILEEVRSQTNLKAITDMWTNLNVSSRLEATEAGIAKLSSLVQDLINETNELQSVADGTKGKSQMSTGPATPSQVMPSQGGLGSASVGQASAGQASSGQVTPSQAGLGQTGAQSGYGLIGTGVDWGPQIASLQEFVSRMRDDLDQLTGTFYSTMNEIQPGIELPPQAQAGPPLAMGEIDRQNLNYVSPSPGGTGTGGRSGTGSVRGGAGGTDDGGGTLAERVNDLDRRIRECCETVNKSGNSVSDQLNSFQDQIDYVTKQVNGLTNTLGSGSLSPDLIKDLQGLMQLFQTVQEMQEQLKKVHNTALQLAAEKEDRQSHLNALLEQIELLKTIKLDREDMAEAMAEKADLRMLARKVSHDQFELACDDLSRGLEHALGKLNMQEALWQQALDDIQREIETKLDKMELSPVRDFFNNKLKQLQENLKQMASLRREAEAAGTKRRLLRGVNCISCDANAVMPMDEPPAIPVSKPLPATLSMKPYLSYELDTIRKAQASNLPHRNMHDWENIEKQMTQPKMAQKVRSGTDKHLCNRYCGGSHTTTTPAQRVARLGHFIKQWGPEVLPLSSGYAAGDDGRMYRVSPTEGANVGPGGPIEVPCTPRTSAKKTEIPELPDDPPNEDCRCLEAPGRSSKS